MNISQICEICGATATCAIQDIKRRDNIKTGFVERKPYGSPHFYCNAHKRDSEEYNVTMSLIWQIEHENNDDW